MQATAQMSARSLVRSAAHPLREGEISDYDPLLELIGDAQFVLLGEASHGTHEFYRERAQITKRLITEKGFTAVAVEAAHPDFWRKYVGRTGAVVGIASFGESAPAKDLYAHFGITAAAVVAAVKGLVR